MKTEDKMNMLQYHLVIYYIVFALKTEQYVLPYLTISTDIITTKLQEHANVTSLPPALLLS